MKSENVRIRVATLGDAAELLKIYEPYVAKTAISFEYETPSLEEFKARMLAILQSYPYLVAESGGEILGYAYAGAFIKRAAYARAAETTIYLKEGKTRQGLGRALYRALEGVCGAQNILNLNACIGYPEVEDEFLTKNSAQFHRRLGFETVGVFHRCGYKFGRWYGMVWMEKLIGEHTGDPAPVIPFPALSDDTLRALRVE